MPAASDHHLDATFLAVSDPTRRAILARLAEGDARVTDLAAPFDMSLNAVSKHLKVLERAGLVRRAVHGREHRLSYHAAPLEDASAWIEQQRRFWRERLDSLERYLTSQTRDETS